MDIIVYLIKFDRNIILYKIIVIILISNLVYIFFNVDKGV